MYSKVNYTVVGIFVLIFGIGMAWFAFWLAKYGTEEAFDLYKLEMRDSVTGLSVDSSVKMRGVDIGSVSKIKINPNNIEVVDVFVKIKKGVPIKEDMVAHTQMFGVTGLLSIEIDGGTNEAKTLLPTETYIPLIQTAPSFLSKLTGDIGGASGRIEFLLKQSQKLLSSHNIEAFGKILENTEIATAKSTQMIDDFSQIKEVMVPAIHSLMQTSEDFKRVTLKVEQSLDRGDYNLDKILEPMLTEVQILTNQLTTMSRELEQDPSKLLFQSRTSRKGPGE
ncbi:MAG: hypothetical protein RL113_715 [Pseudomonadota bacterium]